MIFSSPWFLAFLLGLLALLALPISHFGKKRLLSVASCLFYAAWDWRYVALLLGISVVDYLCAAAIAARRARNRSGLPWLVVSILSNLGILGYFKYCNFFIDNLNGLGTALGLHLPHLSILLPAGISFYTFKTMSYVIDVHRGAIEPCRSWLDYAMFVTFFPELIAGPIVRASVFLPQMTRPIGPTRARLAGGASQFLLGLTKKICADRLGLLASPAFAAPQSFSTGSLWAATLAYSLQIYCDFSGYSDMAIGTARMIGYDLPENFDMPYLAGSITEFWRRWHMTLSFWLRDYLYIPLGGNRRGRARTYLNLFLTMLLGGLWHGASWNFVLWGGLHGLALSAHKLYRERRGDRMLPRWVGVPATFLFVTLLWIPFRAPTFGHTRIFLARLFVPSAGVVWLSGHLFWIALLVASGHALGALLARARTGPPPLRARVDRLLGWIGARLEENRLAGWYVRLGLTPTAGAYVTVVWILLVFSFSLTANTPFIYFQF